MLRYHMGVVTRDNALKRAIKRITTATGSTADFIGDATGFNPERPVSLAIFDARETAPDKLFFEKVPKDARIIYIIGGDSLIDKLAMFKDERVVSLFSYDAQFDDDEFIATATKALRGEVFGLQKYFPWGTTSFSMVVKNHAEKQAAIEILMQYANLAGVRGPVRDRIQLVCDELMMNALYHAPVDKDGKELYAGKTLKELAQLDEVNAIEVRYTCSGRYFGVSVRDGSGSLSRARALEYLRKAGQSATIESKSTGAGLGLVSVLKSTSKLVFNLQPGESTEAVALFDMELFSKGKVGARSLHLHVATPSPKAAEVEAPAKRAATGPATTPANDETPVANVRSQAGTWFLAVVLGIVVGGMGAAVFLRSATPVSAATATASPTIIVSPDPPDAVVTLNGKTIPTGQPITLPSNGADLEIKKPGFQSWRRTVTAADARDREVVVTLLPQ